MQKLNENELAEKSQHFRDFYESLDDSDSRDGIQIDKSALLALSGTERRLAEHLLIERIEGVVGPVIQALADMNSEEGATALKAFAEKARGDEAVEVASALWRIEKWPRAQTMLIDVLEGRLKYFEGADDLDDFEATGRADAARALGDIPGSQTQAALKRALNDPDDMVQHWAKNSLDFLRDDSGQDDDASNLRRWEKQVLEMREHKNAGELVARYGEPIRKEQADGFEIWQYPLGIATGMAHSVHVSVWPDQSTEAYMHMESTSSSVSTKRAWWQFWKT